MDYITRELEIRPVCGCQGTKFSEVEPLNLNQAEITDTLSIDDMYGRTYSKSMDQLGKVANPASGQLNRGNEYFPVHDCA